jgi:hypothetical protein
MCIGTVLGWRDGEGEKSRAELGCGGWLAPPFPYQSTGSDIYIQQPGYQHNTEL